MGRGNRDARQLLYGRRRSGPGPIATLPSDSPSGVLTDEEMLARAEQFPLFEGRFPPESAIHLLAQTPVLSAPPTDKEYSAAVGVLADRTGKRQFIAWTNYGPAGRGESQGKIEYNGDDFDGAIAAVNQRLSQKQSVKARSVYSADGGPHFLTRDQVESA